MGGDIGSRQLGSHPSVPSSGDNMAASAGRGPPRGRPMKRDSSKRKRHADLDSAGESDGPTRSRKMKPGWKSSRPGTDEKLRSFCCPYFKKDPIHHMDCLTFNLKRIQDVKQHLQRKHYQPSIYCPVCQLEFSDIRNRDNHIRLRACTVDSCRAERSNGRIPADKQEQLRVRLRGPDVELWYIMWEIIFDGAPPPSSPYQTTMIEEVAVFLQGFWEQHQSAIMSDILDAPSQNTQSALDRLQLSGLMSTALSRLVGRLKEVIHDEICSAPTSPSSDDSIAASISTTSTEEALVAPLTPPPIHVRQLGETSGPIECAASAISQDIVLTPNFSSEIVFPSSAFEFEAADNFIPIGDRWAALEHTDSCSVAEESVDESTGFEIYLTDLHNEV